MLNKTLAGFFAFFLGMFGVHYFYVGKRSWGIAQMAAFFGSIFMANTLWGPPGDFFGILIAVTVISSLITGIIWWSMPLQKWQAKYDPESLGENNLMSTGQYGPALQADTKALKAEGIRYYRSADYDLAIEAFLEAVDADVSDPGTHFNLACSYAQLGQYPEAMRHLELSVTFGLPKPRRIEKHPALAAMRKTAAFRDFHDNNYRRLNLLVAEPAADSPTAENLENFGTPTMGAELPPLPDYDSPSTAAFDEGPAPAPDLLEQITRLRELHDAGILTQLEYQKQKEKLLG